MSQQPPYAPNQWAPPPPPVGDPGLPPGLRYAGLGARIVQYIIDSILIGIVGILIGIVLVSIGLWTVRYPAGTLSNPEYNVAGLLVTTVIGLAISAAYYIYMWTTQRATIGMRVMGMQIGDADNGMTLTTDQAVRRWVALALPFSLGQILQPIPSVFAIVALAVFVYFLALLYTTYSDARKQGIHDKFAHTVVVRAA